MPDTHYHDKTDNTDKIKAKPKIDLARYTCYEFITKCYDRPDQQNKSDNPFKVHLFSIYHLSKTHLDNFRTKEQLECRNDERTSKKNAAFYLPANNKFDIILRIHSACPPYHFELVFNGKLKL